MNRIKACFLELRNSLKVYKIQKDKSFENNRVAADLIRYTHSIEKGLSIENPRLGFGHKKQELILQYINKLKSSDSEYHKEAIKMSIDALNEYIKFHDSKSFSDDFILKLKDFLKNNEINEDVKYGGVLDIKYDNLNFNVEEIEKLFNTRHSIRDFSNTEVDLDKLKKAIKLAQRAPSACNRQAVRVYVLDKTRLKEMDGWLEGVGGFQDAVDKYILICSKLSSYTEKEAYQHVVSSSIYAGYLSLTLHLYGLGACVIQRAVTYSKKWDKIRNNFNIPEDEQAICLLGVGNLKGAYKVPVSHRLENNEMIKFL